MTLNEGAGAYELASGTTFEAGSTPPETASALTAFVPGQAVDPNLILPAIPEPTTAGLLIGGILLLAVSQRRRRRD